MLEDPIASNRDELLCKEAEPQKRLRRRLKQSMGLSSFGEMTISLTTTKVNIIETRSVHL